ncbi:hypothetical protein [Olivibacter sp. SDN3]|nr:hypothetical protein [Olivibacter sp. SDN3]
MGEVLRDKLIVRTVIIAPYQFSAIGKGQVPYLLDQVNDGIAT